jgi:hypothetical protein
VYAHVHENSMGSGVGSFACPGKDTQVRVQGISVLHLIQRTRQLK